MDNTLLNGGAAKNPIADYLAHQSVIILDGALATELERRGANLFDPLWSAKYLLEQPGLIRAVHLDYFLAGADVATTATYQATFEAFERRGMTHAAAAKLMQDAVDLAVSARDEFWDVPRNRSGRLRPLVAASVGPYGAMLADGSEYRGHYTVDDEALAAFHRPRLRALARSGADLLACETIPCLREALVLARLLEEFPNLTAWVSFSCQDGRRNCEGEDVAGCAAALQSLPQIAAIGINCTPPGYVSELLTRMQTATDKPLLAYPNSGERYNPTTKIWLGACDSHSFARQAQDWNGAGARLLGGCCRTTPQDIHEIRSRFSGAASWTGAPR
jgi:homocysteine S-methyltransferase